MKEKLKTQFNEFYWAQTFDMRDKDRRKTMPAVTLKSHWPGLFTVQGVIIIITSTFLIISKA